MGIITNEDYAIFQNAGYMGLYGRLTVDDIKKRKKLKKSIKQIEKEHMKKLREKAKKKKLILDE